MAKASGLSVSSVQRIWRAFGLQPHRMEMFEALDRPELVAKVRDVVGLYVSPPEHAIVLCVDVEVPSFHGLVSQSTNVCDAARPARPQKP